MEDKKIKAFDVIITIVKIICTILLVLIIIFLALQRFSGNQIAIGGYRVFSVATESMVPKYKVGDVLIIKKVDINDLKVGDDVTYLGNQSDFSGRIVTHQIVQIDETENGKIFHTKGLANEVEDPLIKGDQIYGKVVYKCIIFSLLTKLRENMAAFYIIVFVPLGILVFLQIKDFIEEKKENKEEEKSDEENK